MRALPLVFLFALACDGKDSVNTDALDSGLDDSGPGESNDAITLDAKEQACVDTLKAAETKLREGAYQAIKDACTRGEFAPGDTLSLRMRCANAIHAIHARPASSSAATGWTRASLFRPERPRCSRPSIPRANG